jgi:hypothetical protein
MPQQHCQGCSDVADVAQGNKSSLLLGSCRVSLWPAVQVLQLLHQLKATAIICSMLLPVHRVGQHAAAAYDFGK